KIDKRELRLDWREPAEVAERRVRAFSPSPGVVARARGTELKIWSAAVAAGNGEPGEVLAADPGILRVACAQGALAVPELQRPGGKRLRAAEFLRGFPLSPGERFET